MKQQNKQNLVELSAWGEGPLQKWLSAGRHDFTAALKAAKRISKENRVWTRVWSADGSRVMQTNSPG